MKKRIYGGVAVVVLLWLTFLAIGRVGAGVGRKPVSNPQDSFYVWQRKWNSQVIAAVAEEDSARELYVLFRQIGTKIVRVSPDWTTLSLSHARIVPVFRILYCGNWLENDPEAKRKQILLELHALRKNFLNSGLELDEIQLDLDCPERLVPLYVNFLAALKENLTGIRLSITVLPCHLNNSSFRDLVGQVDEYVLQVHGLKYPKKFGDNVSIMERDQALNAISAAAGYGKPFRVALPTYGYELLFQAKTGRFAGLVAENCALRKPGLKSVYIVPDLLEVKSVRDESLNTDFCRGVVWFRLPVRGDRLCFDRETLKDLQNGTVPDTGLDVTWEREPGNNLTELCLHNKGVLGKVSADILLDWGGNDYCNYGLYPGNLAASALSVPGRIPGRIRCNIPLPGETKKIAWFSNLKSKPKVSIKESGQ